MESQVISAFKERFHDDPTFLVKAPGRASVLSIHTDYNGYPVLAFAISRHVLLAGSAHSQLHISHANTTKYKQEYIADTNTEFDFSKMCWYSYIHCGLRAANCRSGLRMCIDGNIPPGAGLSSSSALVVAGALAGFRFKSESPSKDEIADICCKTERLIGTQGGGMDQAACLLSAPGSALHVGFDPLNVRKFALPQDCSFIIADSCTVKEKALSPEYNTRVSECRLGCLMLAHASGIDDFHKFSRLSVLQKKLELPFNQFREFAELNLRKAPYSKNDILNVIGENAYFIDGVENYYLQQRCIHVITEAERTERFYKICNSTFSENTLNELANLFNASQSSARYLYECSCPEIDELCSVALHAGALGAHLTGAGWGGCVLILANKAKIDEVMETIKSEFYMANDHRRQLVSNETLFAVSPSDGASIIDL